MVFNNKAKINNNLLAYYNEYEIFENEYTLSLNFSFYNNNAGKCIHLSQLIFIFLPKDLMLFDTNQFVNAQNLTFINNNGTI
jgi:hypothetical protein